MNEKPSRITTRHIVAAKALADAIERAALTQEQVAAAVNRSQGLVWQWVNAKFPVSHKLAPKLAELLHEDDPGVFSPEWADLAEVARKSQNDANPARYSVAPAGDGTPGAQRLEFTEALGSCGGGSINHDEELRYLYKEESWFKRYKVPAKNVEMVWADGDSMADFIVDGDIVFFDNRKTTPRSEQIFLIEHPDGLKIKRLRRDIDGTWVLVSNNPDKRHYPDERLAPDQLEHLKIRGEFFYRQG